MSLTVADLFCGAGGFSEGFRQMGFEIKYGLDNWRPATDTFSKNFPSAEAVCADITEVDIDNIPDVDVILGGPPCTFFSMSNKAGGGDVEEGMRLITQFLRIIDAKKPKYWIMENVTNLETTLPEEVELRNLNGGSSGTVRFRVVKPYTSADFGVPQIRRRLFSGEYPCPTQTHSKENSLLSPWMTMREAIGGLPPPLARGAQNGFIEDPNYPLLSIPMDDLMDQGYDTRLQDDEVWKLKRMKLHHKWGGRMVFPDDMGRPSRTIMASLTRTGRETIVLPKKKGERRYRFLTVRECGILQSFPITFQFWGSNPYQKYRLAGNAVPPLLASAFARSILDREGIEPPCEPIISVPTDTPDPLPTDSTVNKNRKGQLSIKRRFWEHIPHSITSHSRNACRVDLENSPSRPYKHPYFVKGKKSRRVRHLKRWECKLYSGYAKSVRSQVVSLKDGIWLISKAFNELEQSRITSFIYKIYHDLPCVVPDASSLQWAHSHRRIETEDSPFRLIENVGRMVDCYFPESIYRNSNRIDASSRIPEAPDLGIPLRTIGHLLATSFASRLANEGVTWIEANRGICYREDDWETSPDIVDSGSTIRCKVVDSFKEDFEKGGILIAGSEG